MRISTLAFAIGFGGLLSGAAYALDATAPADDPGARTVKAAECSKQTDATGLHGKERKKFHSECMKAK
jgi:hypothetical protein